MRGRGGGNAGHSGDPGLIVSQTRSLSKAGRLFLFLVEVSLKYERNNKVGIVACGMILLAGLIIIAMMLSENTSGQTREYIEGGAPWGCLPLPAWYGITAIVLCPTLLYLMSGVPGDLQTSVPNMTSTEMSLLPVLICMSGSGMIIAIVIAKTGSHTLAFWSIVFLALFLCVAMATGGSWIQ